MEILLQILGFVLGFAYLWLEYRASVWVWVVGVVMPIVHSVLFFRVGLYADFGMQAYYVLAGIYGLIRWRSRRGGNELTISHASFRVMLTAAVIFLVFTVVLYRFLATCTDSTVPFWDAMTTALAIVGMWMLSEKWVEQWIVWIVADVITVGLYLYKGIPLTSLLYLVYACMGVAGFMKWKRMASSVKPSE